MRKGTFSPAYVPWPSLRHATLGIHPLGMAPPLQGNTKKGKKPTKNWVLPLGPKFWQSVLSEVAKWPLQFLKKLHALECTDYGIYVSSSKCILWFWHVNHSINPRPDSNTGLSLDIMTQQLDPEFRFKVPIAPGDVHQFVEASWDSMRFKIKTILKE